MKRLLVSDFSLKHTIECGQFFLYEEIEDFYYVINGRNLFKIKQENDVLLYDFITEDEIINFFSLDEDFNKLIEDFRNDKYLLEALEKYWGLRLIRQDLWQCMIGFVCSSASNISKIKKNLKLISEAFGEEIEIDGKLFYSFPQEGKINNLDKLKNAKTGYRAEFIFEINKIILENPQILDEIREADYEKAKKILMHFPGIGPKVADCVCLFALGHKDAFPIDTWIKQIISELYLKKESTGKEIENFIKKNFDVNKGLKQQYLFHYARNSQKNL